MYRCHQCGHYYIPGYLECACRTTERQLHVHRPPLASYALKDQAAVAYPPDAEKPSRTTILALNLPPADNVIVPQRHHAQLQQGVKGG
jgi:hypothetical protein